MIDKIKFALQIENIEFLSEYKFYQGRKFRFDIVILPLDYKIAIEYEGIFNCKSRHTNIIGYSKDCEKYNLAVLQGWKVLRYTAKHPIKKIIEDVKDLLAQKELKEIGL